MKKLNKKMFILGMFIALIAVSPLFTTIANAWHTNQSTSAACQSGIAIINFSFTNTDTQAMVVKAKDEQTGNITDLGTVMPGQTVTGAINTGQTSLNDGIVHFLLTWAQGSGNDTISSNYSAVDCNQPAPTPTPTATPSATTTNTSSGSSNNGGSGGGGGGGSTGAPAPAVCNNPYPAPVITGWALTKNSGELQFNFVEPGIPASQLDGFSIQYGYSPNNLDMGEDNIPNTSTGETLRLLRPGAHVWATVTALKGGCGETSAEFDPIVR